MTTPLLRAALGCALILSLPAHADDNAAAAVAAPAATARALPPISAFFENAEFSGARLSPSGQYLAVIMAAPGRRGRLAVITLADQSAKVVAQFSDADVRSARWISDERLIFDAVDREAAQRDVHYRPGLYAVNRDGSGSRQLASTSVWGGRSSDGKKALPWYASMMDQDGGQNGNDIYVYYDVYAQLSRTFVQRDLIRLNTVTGTANDVSHPDLAQGWMLDQQGEPRLMFSSAKDVVTIRYRDPGSGAWRTLLSYAPLQPPAGSFQPLGFGPDGTLYVVASPGRDKSALYRYDLAHDKLEDRPVIELTDYDFRGKLIMNEQTLLGVQVLSDGYSSVWFDPAMKALQKTVDQLLPSTVNLITPPRRAASPWVMVDSFSDHQPHTYQVYNTATGQLDRIGSFASHIAPPQMGSMELMHYAARDGMDIPAWLSLPRGGGKHLPLVVLVHGGPFARGNEWNWDPQSQFLTSRGYAVLEPEFRGSTGYGYALFRAGWKQWGLKMQDDIADGARWAIAQGIADPKRICIAGGSYGGYAALMGLIRDPDLYKCGVDWAGVTDINLLRDGDWSRLSDMTEEWRKYGMPKMIGDEKEDAEQLQATSPLLQAARIKQPLLLAYGGADHRVPLYHGSKFYDAVKAGNANVEWIVYPEEGHGWYLPQNRIDFWGRVERFLDRNIGPQTQKSASAPTAK